MWKFLFLAEVVGCAGWGEGKVETMSSIELHFRCSAFEVFMRYPHGHVQQAAGYTVEPHAISIFYVCRSPASK